MGGKRRKMIRGLQCSSKQKAAGLPNKMAFCTTHPPIYRVSRAILAVSILVLILVQEVG